MKMKRASFILFRVICLGFSLLLLVMCLLSRISLAQTEARIEDLKGAVSQASSEERLLEAQLESGISLEKLDEYAVNKIGMQHPVQGQIRYIELAG